MKRETYNTPCLYLYTKIKQVLVTRSALTRLTRDALFLIWRTRCVQCTLVILKVHILLYRRMLSATIAVCFLVYMFKITYILAMLLVLSLANTPNLLNSMLYCSSSSYMHTTFMNKALSMYITSIIVVRLVECKLNGNNYITNCQSITLLNFLLKASTRCHSNSNEWDSNHHPPDFNILLFFALKLIFMQYSAENIPRLRETASHFQFSNFQEKENRFCLSTNRRRNSSGRV